MPAKLKIMKRIRNKEYGDGCNVGLLARSASDDDAQLPDLAQDYSYGIITMTLCALHCHWWIGKGMIALRKHIV